MKVLDVFSGIGGFSLGLERTGGFQTIAFCEISEYPRRVLARNWPGVPIYDDIRTVTAARLSADGIVPDVVCGGFPCQDISVAGRGAGLGGDRSGLWFEMLRVIAETRPRYVIAENVAALRGRGLDTCLRGLAEIGFDAEWHIISAAAVGAPHKRERVWIVAYPAWDGRGRPRIGIEHGGASERGVINLGTHCGKTLAHSNGSRRHEQTGAGHELGMGASFGGVRIDELAHPAPRGLRVNGHERGAACDQAAGQFTDSGSSLADASSPRLQGAEQPQRREQIVTAADLGRAASECCWRRAVAGMGGTVDGLSRGAYGSRGVEPWEGETPRTVGKGYPDRRARLMALGNAVVPVIPELIGRAILRVEEKGNGR